MANCTFKFRLLDIKDFTKDNTVKSILRLYCNYGFLVDVFTTKDKANKIVELSKKSDFDISDYISVRYDDFREKFYYLLDI